ncbi:stress response translation initiation inhibitor YciH [Candidatus Woesearchaeota archaeon]|nr:stress response translation initiation inhibitor YciH [Candidatus Woesearchaeota archaeon]
MTVCVTCGLPKELCVCESIAKESQKIIVRVEEKKFNRKYTVVEGIDQKEIDLDGLAKKLKAKLACGGTIKEGRIELQGDHRAKVKQALIEAGFAPETIIVK